ncbi:hypothetical protein EG329_014392 [Mollisiaceae sp. DMI_Dod_QoI]|nr:hypothetical protein EG329_014392 [Helotiales sp. DMI_Dod_QoI]
MEPLQTQILKTRDTILTSENFSHTSKELISFVVAFFLAGKPETANRLLEKLFQITDFSASEDEQLIFELFWNSFPGRPTNTPWSKWDETRLNEAKQRVDPESPKFYEGWTNTSVFETILKITIGPDYDAHQWRISQDPWVHAISARVLCRLKDGSPPTREKLQEAFEAVDKMFAQIAVKDPDPLLGPMFPLHIFFAMAVYLDHQEKARKILQKATKQNEFEIHDLLNIPALYEILAASMDDPPIKLFDETETKEAEEFLCAALQTRAEKGRRPPLHDVPMAEVLRRFSEAAFFVHRDEYLRNEINTPEQILYPPLTPEEIEKFEQTLGPLPADIKEMALIADGFCGGWHFAGGGWPGIQGLQRTSAHNYEVYLGYQPKPEKRIDTRTRNDGTTYQVTVNVFSYVEKEPKRNWGDIYVGSARRECDDFEHILCPPSVWKKYQEHKGKDVKEGEYAYLHFAHWTGGGEVAASVREWIAEMTMDLERAVTIGFRAEPPS